MSERESGASDVTSGDGASRPIGAQEAPGAVSGAMAAKAFKVRTGPGGRKYGLAARSLPELLRKACRLEVGGRARRAGRRRRQKGWPPPDLCLSTASLDGLSRFPTAALGGGLPARPLRGWRRSQRGGFPRPARGRRADPAAPWGGVERM